MKVVVGLGNPGRKYEGTRHNVGFQLVAELARRHGARSPKTKFEAEIAEIQLGSERVLLVAPQTFMNASGRSVRPLADFYQLELSNLLVVCDDIALPLGRIRLRKSGSSGGQKGLENILQQLGTQEVARLRIGVDAPPPQMDAADYVLGRFGKWEAGVVDTALMRAADAVEAWVIDGLVTAMNRFNPPGLDTTTGTG
ncbi:MAG: aminoacyl-tRNA hydrolase [Planctomycetales bacterium]|nr:aminoacyl-tRNA hydrolase [Planctomycetales bacterium]